MYPQIYLKTVMICGFLCSVITTTLLPQWNMEYGIQKNLCSQAMVTWLENEPPLFLFFGGTKAVHNHVLVP